MAVVQFTAARNLAPGFSAGDPVTIFFKVRKAQRTPNVICDVATSLAGLQRTNVVRFENSVDVETQVFTNSNRLIFEMFLESIKARETFYGNFRGDDLFNLTAYRIDGNYVPNDLNLKMSSYSFKVKAI